MVYALYITFPTGYVKVETFPSAFDRSLLMITLAPQPVHLRPVDYIG